MILKTKKSENILEDIIKQRKILCLLNKKGFHAKAQSDHAKAQSDHAKAQSDQAEAQSDHAKLQRVTQMSKEVSSKGAKKSR